MAGFLGMRGTDSWATDERPTHFREAILYEYPNGMAPLMAIMSRLKSEMVDDPEFTWWTKTLASQKGSVTAVYTDSDMSTALASGAASASGTALYVKVSEAAAGMFRAGHQVMLRYTSDVNVDCNAKVTGVVKNGSNSCISVRLIEADDNSTSHDLSNADEIFVVGNINAEASGMPQAIGYDPVKKTNYTQIFITPLSASRTAMQTRYRTGNKYKEMKREILEYHGAEMEKAFIFSVKTDTINSENGMPERTMDGIRTAIKTDASANVHDFTTDTGSAYLGKSWLDTHKGNLTVGQLWMNEKLEIISRNGTGSYEDKLGLCGSGAVAAINNLILAGAPYQLHEKITAYGIKVVEWITPFFTLKLLVHPLFQYSELDRCSIIIFTPRRLTFKYVQDTIYVDDIARKNAVFFSKNGGAAWLDGIKECYLTEASLEYTFMTDGGYLTGLGKDQTAVPAAI